MTAGDRFEGHDPADGLDTGGTPWAGRSFEPTGFESDDGSADPALLAALDVARREPGPAADERLAGAVAAARLLVPVVAVPGEVDTSSGLARDVTSDMASVTLTAPDGARALPAFSSVAALAAWNGDARPVAVTAQRAALAAVQEGCSEIVLDLGAEAAPCVLRPSMVWALAMARPWVPASRDAHVAAAVDRALAAEPAVLGHELGTGDHGLLVITLLIRPGLDEPGLQRLVTAVGESIAADGEVRARIDAVAFRLQASDEPA